MKSNVAALAVLITVLIIMTLIMSTHALAGAAVPSSFNFVMGPDSYIPSDTTMPQKGTKFIDPNFHTQIVRITDKSDGYSGAGIENEYSKVDPENSDGAYVILRGNDGEWYLYDASTFQMKEHLAGITGGEEPEPRWDALNPKIFYYLCGTELRSYHIGTDASTTIHDFNKEFPSAAYISTKSEGDASLDRRFWSFMVEDSSYSVTSVIVFDRTSNSIVGKKNGFPDSVNWVSMGMSGKHCVIGYDTHVTQVFSKDFSTGINLPEGANGHMDFALTPADKDVMVYQNTATDWIAMADLGTGVETPLVKIPFDVNSDIGLHFSGNCADTPGWVLVSTYGSKNTPLGENHSWMDTQLFMVELRANPNIWRIAHTHSYTHLDYTDEKNYFAEAFASINTRGSKIYFGANWGHFNTDYTDTYQVTLPTEWFTTIPEFPPLLVMPLFLLTTLLAAILYRRKKCPRKELLSIPALVSFFIWLSVKELSHFQESVLPNQCIPRC